MELIAQMMSPVAPFFSDFLFKQLNDVSSRNENSSVHLTLLPKADENVIDKDLEERMELAQNISSMVLSIRKQVKIKVRQPLNKVMIPILDERLQGQIEKVEPLILSEINVKELKYVKDASGVIVKKAKPNFKLLGKKLGPKMKEVGALIQQMDQDAIQKLEQEGQILFDLGGESIEITTEEVLIMSEDIPGWEVNSNNGITVALDTAIDDKLKAEGDAREIVNRIQRLRKDQDFNLTDKIKIRAERNNDLDFAINEFKEYICSETLTQHFELVDTLDSTNTVELDINDTVLKLDVSLNQ